jgi:hypothetical protein
VSEGDGAGGSWYFWLHGPENAEASFVSTGSIPIRMDKYNKKIMIVIIRDPDLFRSKINLLMVDTPKGSESIH